MDLDVLKAALVPVAREAGTKIMEVYQKPAEAEYKGDGSPVTEADAAAEAIILPALHAAAPDITVISEENAASHALTAPETFFLVDPLDGTKEFLKRDGKGSFTVNIALIEKGRPVFGVVYAPALDRMFVGIVGHEAEETSGGVTRKISVRNVPESGAVAVASASHRDADTDAWLSDHGIDQTTSIGSSLKFCLVAAGEADVYPRFAPTMEWDTGAGHAVLAAAGGRVTNPDKTDFTFGKTDYRNGPFVAWGGLE
ncbi:MULTISPECIES: 3'(2'),5'-bisphosphate nucleotidase CysQ [unclassified Ruegeria]|uniref:3'(2'),5'-bisphosphate nucleotidase CysQ n=1 Tax=unclassified Ruegeria TaxID=2625375 RepID=UPI00148955E1|nr:MULTISPECIES: 3'(2'),5'-bisphosphate nucleotidase CysQ [unclassified Ruegeria]NOD62901.1 3'(2'),5'-bisphosphate nucleotidase CysQ [Ruegeria sp. HKCCD6109]